MPDKKGTGYFSRRKKGRVLNLDYLNIKHQGKDWENGVWSNDLEMERTEGLEHFKILAVGGENGGPDGSGGQGNQNIMRKTHCFSDLETMVALEFCHDISGISVIFNGWADNPVSALKRTDELI
jgi:hypothetical protein